VWSQALATAAVNTLLFGWSLLEVPRKHRRDVTRIQIADEQAADDISRIHRRFRSPSQGC
jgi:hypothetical protein